MIPQRNISLLANRLARMGGRRIPESVIERDYCLAWFLVGLAHTHLQERIAFKGGTALKRCYFHDYRFSEDLDFTLTEPTPFDEIRRLLEEVYATVRDASGIEFVFSREDRDAHENSHTFYLDYTGPLPAGGGVKVDITIREHVVFPLEAKAILRGYDEFQDLPDAQTLPVYSLEEITCEKVLALVDRARNEPRDLYDLWYLTTQADVDLATLLHAIEAKLTFRNRATEGLQQAIVQKEARLKRLWSGRLANQISTLPPFDQVFRELRRVLRRAGLP